MATIEPLGSLQVAVMLMRNHNHWVLAGVLLLLSLLLVGACFGDPAAPIRIENRTDQSLTIFINDIYVGDVAPGVEIKNKRVTFYGEFLIEARDAQGETIHSEKFTYEELKRIDWKVVIPPLQSK